MYDFKEETRLLLDLARRIVSLRTIERCSNYECPEGRN